MPVMRWPSMSSRFMPLIMLMVLVKCSRFFLLILSGSLSSARSFLLFRTITLATFTVDAMSSAHRSTLSRLSAKVRGRQGLRWLLSNIFTRVQLLVCQTQTYRPLSLEAATRVDEAFQLQYWLKGRRTSSVLGSLSRMKRSGRLTGSSWSPTGRPSTTLSAGQMKTCGESPTTAIHLPSGEGTAQLRAIGKEPITFVTYCCRAMAPRERESSKDLKFRRPSTQVSTGATETFLLSLASRSAPSWPRLDGRS
mmetsp:Transcript_28996/g.61183  ORF Transcript_28996/g.61183 Transcript_28996/m.61183 type:complete len:251 (+) Transcript_28996:335-1087(+)